MENTAVKIQLSKNLVANLVVYKNCAIYLAYSNLQLLVYSEKEIGSGKLLVKKAAKALSNITGEDHKLLEKSIFDAVSETSKELQIVNPLSKKKLESFKVSIQPILKYWIEIQNNTFSLDSINSNEDKNEFLKKVKDALALSNSDEITEFDDLYKIQDKISIKTYNSFFNSKFNLILGDLLRKNVSSDVDFYKLTDEIQGAAFIDDIGTTEGYCITYTISKDGDLKVKYSLESLYNNFQSFEEFKRLNEANINFIKDVINYPGSRKELSEKLDISQTMLSRIVKGRARASERLIVKLAGINERLQLSDKDIIVNFSFGHIINRKEKNDPLIKTKIIKDFFDNTSYLLKIKDEYKDKQNSYWCSLYNKPIIENVFILIEPDKKFAEYSPVKQAQIMKQLMELDNNSIAIPDLFEPVFN